MSTTSHPALIVARYLKANGYTQSYDAFVEEAGLPIDAGSVKKGDLTLETLLEEKRTYDVSVNFEKLGVEDGIQWSTPVPSVADIVSTLPSSSNILSAQVLHAENNSSDRPADLLASTADRRLCHLDATNGVLMKSSSDLHDSPILSFATARGILLSASMSGQLVLSDGSGKVLESRRDHTKYIIKIAVYNGTQETLIATAGWDGRVLIYKSPHAGDMKLGQPFTTIVLATKPESIIFTIHPHTQRPVLLVSRADSTFIHYYTIEETARLLGRQNLAPHSNAWVAFSPSAMELCPTDPSVIAVGTSSTPHMKLLIVRLLFPPWEDSPPSGRRTESMGGSLAETEQAAVTQASQARAAIALADREAAAIQIQSTTMAPQTAFSTPAVAWRPDGSGVWVNGDDGVVRGIEASSGKILQVLQGHEPGSKVRCLWAGRIRVNNKMVEILVSGGFDQKLIIWRTGP